MLPAMPTRLADARRHALSLPEASESPHHHMSSFRVRGKIFATVPPEGSFLHLFVDEAARDAAVAAEPEAFEPLLWGGKVVGVRAVLALARPAAVKALLQAGWLHRAPASIKDRR